MKKKMSEKTNFFNPIRPPTSFFILATIGILALVPYAAESYLKRLQDPYLNVGLLPPIREGVVACCKIDSIEIYPNCEKNKECVCPVINGKQSLWEFCYK